MSTIHIHRLHTQVRITWHVFQRRTEEPTVSKAMRNKCSLHKIPTQNAMIILFLDCQLAFPNARFGLAVECLEAEWCTDRPPSRATEHAIEYGCGRPYDGQTVKRKKWKEARGLIRIQFCMYKTTVSVRCKPVTNSGISIVLAAAVCQRLILQKLMNEWMNEWITKKIAKIVSRVQSQYEYFLSILLS